MCGLWIINTTICTLLSLTGKFIHFLPFYQAFRFYFYLLICSNLENRHPRILHLNKYILFYIFIKIPFSFLCTGIQARATKAKRLYDPDLVEIRPPSSRSTSKEQRGTAASGAAQKTVRIKLPPDTPIPIKFMMRIVRELLQQPIALAFSRPVNPQATGALDYYSIISNPSDLGTIKQNLEQGRYNSVNEIRHDLQLIWDNCRRYNPPTHPLCHDCAELEALMNKRLSTLPRFVLEDRANPTDEELAQLSLKDQNFARSVGGPRQAQHTHRRDSESDDSGRSLLWAEDEYTDDLSMDDYRASGGGGKKSKKGRGGRGRSSGGGYGRGGRSTKSGRNQNYDWGAGEDEMESYMVARQGDDDPLSFDEVQSMKEQIQDMEDSELSGLVKLVQSEREGTDNENEDDDTIEFDLLEMTPQLQHKLQRYIQSIQLQRQRKSESNPDNVLPFF